MREKGLKVVERSRPTTGRGEQVVKEEAGHRKVTKFSSSNVYSYITLGDP